MGIRESLLNTITSVADSDFVRIVTSAGASSKATVKNLFKGFESNLSAKSSLTTSDYIRVVGSDNEAYKQLVSDVAKKIIENYTGSSLAGSSQSVKNALDALSTNKAVTVNHSQSAIRNIKDAFASYATGFTTQRVASDNGPFYYALVFKYSDSYGCALIVTYASSTETNPIFLQFHNGTWTNGILLR